MSFIGNPFSNVTEGSFICKVHRMFTYCMFLSKTSNLYKICYHLKGYSQDLASLASVHNRDIQRRIPFISTWTRLLIEHNVSSALRLCFSKVDLTRFPASFYPRHHIFSVGFILEARDGHSVSSTPTSAVSVLEPPEIRDWTTCLLVLARSFR